MTQDSGSPIRASDSDRHRRIEELVEDCRQQSVAGQPVNQDDIIAEYPDLMPELGERLHELLGMILKADENPAEQTRSLRPQHMPADSEAPGDQFPGYEIVRELHRGGQGVVYLAVQASTKRKVAIKVLLDGAFASKSAKQRFDREVELVAQLKHPNIIGVYHTGITADGRQFYVMDYVRGWPLNRYVREHQLSLEAALELFATVSEAVSYAHQKGVIHRDLKPSNIMVDAEGVPKVLDFGLARAIGGSDQALVSVTGQIIGTLPYLSPEQARGNPDEIDIRTDVYALGVILYEMLTGQYPYPVVGQMADVLRHIAETPPTPPTRQWNSSSGVTKRSSRLLRGGQCPIDGELQTVVLKALSKERERRYQSAGDLAREIGRYLIGEPIDAKRDSGWYILRKKLRRHRLGVSIAAVAVALLCVFGLYARQNARLREDARLQNARLREAERLYDEGVSLSKNFEDDGAAYAKFEQALELNPLENRAWSWLGHLKRKAYFEASFKKGNRKLLIDANELFDRSLEITEHRSAWNHKCIVLYSLGELTEAEQACERAVELDSDYPYTVSSLAKVQSLQLRFDEALETAQLATAISTRLGKNSERDDSVWRTLGALQLVLGDPECLNSLEKAKEIHRQDAKNSLILARIHLFVPEYRDDQLALQEAKDAEAYSDGDDPRYHRVLAQALLRNDQFEDAARHAEAAIRGGDEPAYGHLIRAICEARSDNFDAARVHLASAMDNWPKDFEEGTVMVSAYGGLLWFDTLAELEQLRSEAQQLLPASPD